MDPYLKEIQEAFLVEASELLVDVEAYFLDLEKNPNDASVLDKLFRLAHNLKGSGKAVGFEELSKFSHQIESLLVSIRNRQVTSSPQVMQLLLNCCDHLKDDVELLKVDPLLSLDHGKLMSQLQQACAGEFSTPDPACAITENKDTLSEAPAVPAPVAVPVVNEAPVERRKASGQEDSIRVSVKKIEEILNSLGEQVILQSTLDYAKEDLLAHKEAVFRTITQLNKITHDLQQAAMGLRMVSLKTIFSRLERAARDASLAVKKDIDFITHGSDNELDKSIVDALLDPLIHMVRNSVDHGVESAEERLAAGKSARGQVSLSGYRSGGYFCLELKDDGKGLNPEKILQKALSQGIIKEGERLTKPQIFDLIFRNGFSTKDQVSDISGRGVGMNVVYEAIQSLKGSCEIESEVGVGTTFRLRLPLTLAIFNGMIVRVGSRRFVVPASDVEAVVNMDSCELRALPQERQCLRVKEEVLPVLDLRNRFARWIEVQKAVNPLDKKRDSVLICRQGQEGYAVVVDEVLVLQKVVHKNLTPELRQFKGASGATILGDGQVALILDINALLNKQNESRTVA